jgi:hypothetical protein
MADEYSKIKRTSEYGHTKREVEDMIKRAVDPLKSQLAEMTAALEALEKKFQALEGRLPKP